jgi:RHS repeat-associated protein
MVSVVEAVRGMPGQGCFTGKERDSELASSAMQGLDYFGERYFSSAQGRFTSPDALIAKKEWLVDPQRWNHYAYVTNNPLRYVDPDGEDLTVIYSYGPDLDDNQRKWFEANKGKIFDAIRAKYETAGVKNVVFTNASALSKADLAKLQGQPVLADDRLTNTTGAVRLQITGARDGVHPGEAPLGVLGATYHGQSAVFMDRLNGAGSSTCDSACAFANVAAHEIGHAVGFDDPGHGLGGVSVSESVRQLLGGAPDLMMQGQDPARQPMNFNMAKDKNLKAIQEVNRVGAYPK